jgi:HAD superfamily hydrolase (TIGR01509 family)
VIKAVVFDFFGVLSTDGWIPLKNKYFGQDKKLFEEANILNQQVNIGAISPGHFFHRIAEMANISETEVHHQLENNVPNQELFKFIETKLKPTYKLGILSNASANWLDRILTKAQLELFDATVLSFQISIIKPDPTSYKTIAERLKVQLPECVLVDDKQRFCDGAIEVGMQAVLYIDVKQLERDLTKVLTSA